MARLHLRRLILIARQIAQVAMRCQQLRTRTRVTNCTSNRTAKSITATLRHINSQITTQTVTRTAKSHLRLRRRIMAVQEVVAMEAKAVRVEACLRSFPRFHPRQIITAMAKSN